MVTATPAPTPIGRLLSNYYPRTRCTKVIEHQFDVVFFILSITSLLVQNLNLYRWNYFNYHQEVIIVSVVLLTSDLISRLGILRFELPEEDPGGGYSFSYPLMQNLIMPWVVLTGVYICMNQVTVISWDQAIYIAFPFVCAACSWYASASMRPYSWVAPNRGADQAAATTPCSPVPLWVPTSGADPWPGLLALQTWRLVLAGYLTGVLPLVVTKEAHVLVHRGEAVWWSICFFVQLAAVLLGQCCRVWGYELQLRARQNGHWTRASAEPGARLWTAGNAFAPGSVVRHRGRYFRAALTSRCGPTATTLPPDAIRPSIEFLLFDNLERTTLCINGSLVALLAAQVVCMCMGYGWLMGVFSVIMTCLCVSLLDDTWVCAFA